MMTQQIGKGTRIGCFHISSSASAATFFPGAAVATA